MYMQGIEMHTRVINTGQMSRVEKAEENTCVGKHQRNHQCETLPCPWQLRMRTARQLMHRGALSRRHKPWKVGQNKECSQTYQQVFIFFFFPPEYTMYCDAPHVRFSISMRSKTPFSPGCRHASTISTGSDYMNLNWPQFDTSVDPRWLLSFERHVARPCWLRVGMQRAKKGRATWNISRQFANMNEDASPWGPEVGMFVALPSLLSVFPKMTEINRWMDQSPGLMYST